MIPLPEKYSREFPRSKIFRFGHDYIIKQIPDAIWDKAVVRAHAHDQSIRHLLISFLRDYGDGKV